MTAFKSKYVIDIYAMALDGANDKTIAKALGVTPAGFVGWKRTRKSVQYALKRAKKDKAKSTNLNWSEYIRGRLPIRLQKIWDDITQYEKDPSGYGKIEKLINGKSKRVRQQLLVYALLISGFNLSKALRKVAIPRNTFLHWAENDPDFVDLLTEIEQVKKDFFEEGLIRLIKSGDSPATIFANRTVNRDRGYNDVLETRVSGTVDVRAITINELDLSPDVLRAILNAVHARDAIENKSPLPNKIVGDVLKRKRIPVKIIDGD
jgi:hypothetical protein